MGKEKLCKSQWSWVEKIIHSYGSVTDDLVCMGKSLLAFLDLRFDIQAIFTAAVLIQQLQQMLFLRLYLLIVKTTGQV